MIAARLPAMVLLALGAGSLPALAQTAEGDRKDQFIAAIEKNDCAMTLEQAEVILPKLNFTPEETAVFVEDLMNEGQATVDGDLLTLKTENCR